MSYRSMLAALCGLAGTVAATGYKNVYGEDLKPCSTSGMALTGWTRSGSCSEKQDDVGSHHICIDVASTKGGNFCEVTMQGDWCDGYFECDGSTGMCPVKDWCVCQWAFEGYLKRAGGCDKIQAIKCDAVNEEALKAYASNPEMHKEAYDCLVSRCNLNPKETIAAALPATQSDAAAAGAKELPASVRALAIVGGLVYFGVSVALVMVSRKKSRNVGDELDPLSEPKWTQLDPLSESPGSSYGTLMAEAVTQA